jgi:hypothetical protein
MHVFLSSLPPGWNPPSPERRVVGGFNRTHGLRGDGIANSYNHRIHGTLQTISTRKP